MRGVVVGEPGGAEALEVRELPDLEPGPGEVLLDVVASAVNRADTLQRQGFYPPPPGASDVLGLGVMAEIAARGGKVGHDVAVVGFDDTDIGQVSGLSSLTQPLVDVATHTARMIAALLDGSAPPSAEQVLLAPALVVRSSSEQRLQQPEPSVPRSPTASRPSTRAPSQRILHSFGVIISNR